MIELKKRQFERVRELFRPLRHHLVIFSVIKGETPGRIWVDNTAEPETAVLWDQVDMGVYLTGKPRDKAFNQDFNQTLLNDIYFQAKVMPHKETLTFYPHAVQWEPQFRTLLAGTGAMRDQTIYLVAHPQTAVDPLHLLAPTFTLTQITLPILSAIAAQTKEHPLVTWAVQSYGSIEQFTEKCAAFGVIDNQKNELVAWSIAKFITTFDTAASCEIHIQTVPAYRGQGLATALAKATAQYGFQQGCQEIGCHCLLGNAAAISVAQAAGFVLTSQQLVYHSWVNPIDNYLMQAQRYEQLQNWEAQAEALRKAFIMVDARVRDVSSATFWQNEGQKRLAYETAATAYVRLEDYWGALDVIERAIFDIEWGWNDWILWSGNSLFDDLRATAAWREFVAHVENALTDTQLFDDSDLPEYVS